MKTSSDALAIFVASFGTTFILWTPTSSSFSDMAKGIDNNGICTINELYGDRAYGPGSGECWAEDNGNGVCTVTFPFSPPTTAYHVSGICLPWEILYIQD